MHTRRQTITVSNTCYDRPQNLPFAQSHWTKRLSLTVNQLAEIHSRTSLVHCCYRRESLSDRQIIYRYGGQHSVSCGVRNYRSNRQRCRSNENKCIF